MWLMPKQNLILSCIYYESPSEDFFLFIDHNFQILAQNQYSRNIKNNTVHCFSFYLLWPFYFLPARVLFCRNTSQIFLTQNAWHFFFFFWATLASNLPQRKWGAISQLPKCYRYVHFPNWPLPSPKKTEQSYPERDYFVIFLFLSE